MEEYVLRMKKKDLDALAIIRCINSIQVATDNEILWIKVPFKIYQDENSIKQLPVENTFMVDAEGKLFQPGGLTPIDVLKELDWQPVTELIKVELPVSMLPGIVEQKISFNIISSKNVQQGTALLTSLAVWKNYAETASSIRLNNLRFAVSENNEVLVIGNPLPPLPGTEYWINNDNLIPCGYDFEHTLESTLIKEQYNPGNDSLLVFNNEGKIQSISKTLFVPAKRSAIRLTKENSPVAND